MTALRQEMIHYIENMPEQDLEALRPVVLRLMPSPDTFVVETDLTDEERGIIAARYAECMADPEAFTELKAI